MLPLHPKVINCKNMRLSNFRAMMQAYKQKDYIPIIKFASSSSEEDSMDEIIGIVEDVVISQIGDVSNVSTGLRYIIGENIDNIVQHSKSQYGMICAKVNRERKYVELQEGIFSKIFHDIPKIYKDGYYPLLFGQRLRPMLLAAGREPLVN